MSFYSTSKKCVRCQLKQQIQEKISTFPFCSVTYYDRSVLLDPAARARAHQIPLWLYRERFISYNKYLQVYRSQRSLDPHLGRERATSNIKKKNALYYYFNTPLGYPSRRGGIVRGSRS